MLCDAGFAAASASNGVIEVEDTMAVERPDEIARLLVDAGQAPTMLNVEQEDLEQYFLRLVGLEKEYEK